MGAYRADDFTPGAWEEDFIGPSGEYRPPAGIRSMPGFKDAYPGGTPGWEGMQKGLLSPIEDPLFMAPAVMPPGWQQPELAAEIANKDANTEPGQWVNVKLNLATPPTQADADAFYNSARERGLKVSRPSIDGNKFSFNVQQAGATNVARIAAIPLIGIAALLDVLGPILALGVIGFAVTQLPKVLTTILPIAAVVVAGIVLITAVTKQSPVSWRK
jgi:hypothetical protein